MKLHIGESYYLTHWRIKMSEWLRCCMCDTHYTKDELWFKTPSFYLCPSCADMDRALDKHAKCLDEQ